MEGTGTVEAARLTEIYFRQVDMVYRLCYAYLKNSADAEDAVQNTFIRLMQSGKCFESTEHEKAWLIVTAGNLCRDQLRHWWRKRASLEEWDGAGEVNEPEPDETLEAVLALPGNYRAEIYLYYYEGYTGAEIAELLKKPPSTVRNDLSRARKLLRKKLGGELDEG